jgi:hypothetical protein
VAGARNRPPIRKQPALHLLQLEDRLAPAVTASLVGSTLTVSFSAAGDVAFLEIDSGNLEVGTTFGNNDVFSTLASNVTKIVLQDTGSNANQSATFVLNSSSFTLSDGLQSTGVETVIFNAAVNAGGGSAAINVNASTQIVVNPLADLTGGSGGVTLIGGSGTFAGNAIGVTLLPRHDHHDWRWQRRGQRHRRQ